MPITDTITKRGKMAVQLSVVHLPSSLL